MPNTLERLRAKPNHIRHRIAYGTAAGVTAVVGLVWAGVFISSAPLALAPAGSDTAAAQNTQAALAETKSNFSQLLSAVGAAGGASQPAALAVAAPATTSAPATPPADPTVIPF